MDGSDVHSWKHTVYGGNTPGTRNQSITGRIMDNILYIHAYNTLIHT